MLTAIIVIFIIGYLAIALEEPLEINKTASALITGVLCWTAYVLISGDPERVVEELSHHLGSISEILFFLLGAMTIVELVDAHDGFAIITDRIKTKNPIVLLWIICVLTFFLSALLDNLTTSIVMVSLLRKVMPESDQRKIMAGMIIIAANSGGAWSPIGDVTTTMLWIGGQITTFNIIVKVIVPSLVSLAVPLLFLTFVRRKTLLGVPVLSRDLTLNEEVGPSRTEGRIMFFAGTAGLLFVPIFKTVTHLPPYMGMLLSLGALWVLSEIIHKDKDEEDKKPYTAAYALSKIDASSILFFLGILSAVGVLEVTNVLTNLATSLDNAVGNLDLIVVIIGAVSAVVDNVPIVAAAMGMYDMTTYPVDHKLWEFMAYCAGTGGSMLVIGSAAGVAVMGIEKLDFMWYIKRISFLALIGYLAGAGVYLLLF
ncbi:sodium:proton antiporter NhaD [Rhabdobacter roseus]|uniref:Na+/H+ antiporter NhaD/arsenite permease-like protein n=1 Tax=Rhabdobacter roseus TaxID=1655419 RepID=A0A840U0U3_9BACT|nr:sodium:proton antiporter NhaD [Rhabdobacter roseus]MBB5285998.1 Na+/H+ antiporter NhaD/arsenite permease-like protein [Rhabdobacter roseus]